MKKRITNFITIALFFIVVSLISGCQNSKKKENSSNASDFYGLGAVTTVNLLKNNMNNKSRNHLNTSNVLDKFNAYFSSLDYFSSNEFIQTIEEKNLDDAFPYETKMTIIGQDMNGLEKKHILYFTETLVKEEIEDEETTRDYELLGVMIDHDIKYYLKGNREVEIEDDEHENELKIRAYQDLNDPLNYVEMKQEISLETDETEKEYRYRIYSDGIMIEETSVEFEPERKNNQEQLEYEIEFLYGTGKGKYTVESVLVDGVAQIKVTYNLMGNRGSFEIQKRKNEDNAALYDYIFSDGTHQSY